MLYYPNISFFLVKTLEGYASRVSKNIKSEFEDAIMKIAASHKTIFNIDNILNSSRKILEIDAKICCLKIYVGFR